MRQSRAVQAWVSPLLRATSSAQRRRGYEMSKDGGPAFPFSDGAAMEASEGMSLRDYFAAHAPPPPDWWHGGQDRTADIAEWKWNYADEMLRARSK